MKYSLLTFLALASLNGLVYQGIFERVIDKPLEIYFLDVGQGDSQLVVLPGGAKLLIDGGSGKQASFELGEILSPTDRYIDMIAITHPQLDHFGGLGDVIERFEVGALLISGREGQGEAWENFKDKVIEKKIAVVDLMRGDEVLYGSSAISVISPDQSLLSEADTNESSLVLLLEAEGTKSLFTGDIGIKTEEVLSENEDLDIDILKVAHHGSRYSSGTAFLEEATPAISVIGVGNNRFGHPSEATLQRLARVGSAVYRTDEHGTVKLVIENSRVGVAVER